MSKAEVVYFEVPFHNLVVNGKTGLLVSPGNSEALGLAVLQPLQDPQKCERWGWLVEDLLKSILNFPKL